MKIKSCFMRHNRHAIHRFIRLWLGLLAFVVLCAQAEVDIKDVRLWRAPDHTRLVFDLTGPVQHNLFTLSNPDRVVIDVDDARFKASLKGLNLNETPIKQVRYAPRNGDNVRIVLDMSAQVNPNSFFLKHQPGAADRLVVDLNDREPTSDGPPKVTMPDASASKRDIIIAVDAGHGGEDPGASSSGGLHEKDITLKIAKALAAKISARKGYIGKLVRTGDYYIPLSKRRDIARQMKADLFVSIHADAFTQPSARGASVFALSRRGATSEMARFLARSENNSDLIGGTGGVSLEDKDKMLAGVLVDLSMTATLGASLKVAGDVLRSVGRVAYLHKGKVEQAGFAVLKSPDVPSILVETGFISNPREARNLSSSRYQHKLAAQVWAGIQQYFKAHTPPGTYLAWQNSHGHTSAVQAAREYTITRGDTLSGIAVRFNTSVDSLQRANNLDDQTIQVGQKLRIPTS